MLLPITNYKNEIIEAVRSHSFTIISAETGSGKSTQIPQYLADYYEQVIVTEPRIMAAKTLAKRVAEEMEDIEQHSTNVLLLIVTYYTVLMDFNLSEQYSVKIIKPKMFW